MESTFASYEGQFIHLSSREWVEKVLRVSKSGSFHHYLAFCGVVLWYTFLRKEMQHEKEDELFPGTDLFRSRKEMGYFLSTYFFRRPFWKRKFPKYSIIGKENLLRIKVKVKIFNHQHEGEA